MVGKIINLIFVPSSTQILLLFSIRVKVVVYATLSIVRNLHKLNQYLLYLVLLFDVVVFGEQIMTLFWSNISLLSLVSKWWNWRILSFMVTTTALF